MSVNKVLPTLNKLTRRQKMKVVRILAQELGIEQELFPAQPKKVFYIYTPYNMYGVARLMKESKQSLLQKNA